MFHGALRLLCVQSDGPESAPETTPETVPATLNKLPSGKQDVRKETGHVF